jgi:hypothetical protein
VVEDAVLRHEERHEDGRRHRAMDGIKQNVTCVVAN